LGNGAFEAGHMTTAATLDEQVREFAELAEAMGSEAFQREVADACTLVVECFAGGNKLLTCGNGGSATDAAHLAEELVGRYRGNSNRRSLPAVHLGESGAITCIANDWSFDQVFSRQVEGLAQQGDVLVAFSTSGNSRNVLAAIQAAQGAGAKVLLLTGSSGGEGATRADVVVRVPSSNTARIQEAHTFVLHAICEACEGKFAR